ncbi:N-methyl-L-tryptophan oxidase [Pararhodonellum marinum]|uniref:N-methyl-L-tryptophan oxidase n=1 Tax=Pararhodonellum marinum TaxID=2755358 RepID=UPI00188E61AF|nr:N-methyl-L-tryptophan oxidase [Pararhodonellum marinum]
MKVFDLAVIGLGALGSSALWHLSQSGKRVLGLDQYAPPHTLGSTHGESRITRLAVGEGKQFVPLVKRSHEIWRHLEKLTGKNIMTTTGGLLLDSATKSWSKHGSEGFFERTLRIAREEGIAHEVLEARHLSEIFPEFNIGAEGKVYYEPSAGLLRPELAVRTQLDLAEKNKAVIRTHTKVYQFEPLPGGGVQIKTSVGDFEAGRVLLSAGAWLKDFLTPERRSHFKVSRQMLHWLPIKEGAYQLGKCPVFMWGYGPRAEDFIYGFPSLDGSSIKVATESFVESRHPDTLLREITIDDQKAFVKEKLAERLNFLKPGVERSQVCLYTLTDDANFVVDQLEDFPEVIMASACSGHGFKHSAGLGEALAKKLLDQSPDIDLAPFLWNA